MNFRVGQRVRIIQAPIEPEMVGREAVIVGFGRTTQRPQADCEIDCPSCRSPSLAGHWSARFCQLAPLTDPAADAFVERIKKLAREPQPLAKEKA